MSDLMLTEDELSELEQMFNEGEARAAAGQPAEFWRCYERLDQMLLTGHGVTAADPVYGPTVLWLDGATEANASRGAFSALIRSHK